MNPHLPHPFVMTTPNGTWCAVCGRSNTGYARRTYHTPPFQEEGVKIIFTNSRPDESVPEWTRPLTEAEQKAARSGWPDFHGGKRHPFATSTGMEGGCHHCGFASDSPLHEKPWEPPRVANSAPVSTEAPHITDTSFAARQQRLSGLKGLAAQYLNPPAVSTPTGGEPENSLQEDDKIMNLKLDVSVSGVDRIYKLIAAINDIEGVHLDDLQEDVPPAIKPLPARAAARRVSTTRDGKRRLLIGAAASRNVVKIDYVDRNGNETRGRRVVPISFEDDLLLARDPNKNDGIRQFYLSHIESVEVL